MVIDDILIRYKENYRRIFESIYPSKNGTGFTERNLSVNFAKAYESVYGNAITWYEFQFGEKNNLHYDAIIINPENKEIVVIESKRFSQVYQKVRDISGDIDRIRKFKTEYFKEFIDRIPDVHEYSVKGAILADVWTETSLKIDIKESFCKSTFGQHYLSGIFADDSWFVNGQYFCENFADINVPAIRKSNTIPTNYYLLGMIWNVE